VSAYAAEKLVIISPHRKSIQEEFMPKFKEYYKSTYGTEIEIDWLDQGGTSDDIRFVRSKYKANPKTSNIDIFWGGGATTFIELAADNLLQSHKLPTDLQKQLPNTAAGVSLYDKGRNWYGSAISSFGIFYNKKILKFDNLKEPKTWSDLADFSYNSNLVGTDPRHSGSVTLMYFIIMQSLGWEQGYEMLTRLAGNMRKFSHSSSDPIKSVVSGDAAASLAIDFYANSKIVDLGENNLGFVLPEGQTVVDPDPVAILKGAPNQKAAERFVHWVLSPQAQKLLVLPKGAKEGPRFTSLGRMSVNSQVYSDAAISKAGGTNPFELKSSLKLDINKAAKLKSVFIDLIGAYHVDTHKQLRKAWKNSNKWKNKELIAKLLKAPVSEKEILKYAEKWDDAVYRNKVINGWISDAKTKYKIVAKGK
jgi:ABC-type Fe3+ transport system substrate-binding protein